MATSNRKQPNQARLVQVSDEEAGQRLDNFLIKHLKGVPRSVIYRIVRTGQVRVNRCRVQVSYRIQAGDEVRLPPVQTRIAPEAVQVSEGLKAHLQAAVLYEDEGMFIINKPSGLAVHGGSGIQCGLIEALQVIYPQYRQLELAHRLDRDTSGCIMVAKKRGILKQLHQMLRDGEVRKTYHAIVEGAWPEKCQKIDQPLLKLPATAAQKMVVADSKRGKSAVTTFEVLQVLDGATLLAVHPKTGRTHQIRVHTQVSGYPIIGDVRYNTAEQNRYWADEKCIHRLCLHAKRLSLYLPEAGLIQVEAPYDQAFSNAIERLTL